MERTDERIDERICEMIGAAVLAGAYGSLAREMPDAARGLCRMRVKWSERVQALAQEICAAAEFDARTAART